MKLLDVEQGSPEWHAARATRVTASNIANVMAKGRSGSEAAVRKNYRSEIVSARLGGQSVEGYKSPAMQWGNDHEDEACLNYALISGLKLKKVGFVLHPTMESDAGASPDRLAGDDGLAQIKCPQATAHIKFLRTRKIETAYIKQMQWEMVCADRKWCDFVSYNPTFPPEMQIEVERVHRDDAMLNDITQAVLLFLGEVKEECKALRALYPSLEQAA